MYLTSYSTFYRIVRNRATEKAKADMNHGQSPVPQSGPQPVQQIQGSATPVITQTPAGQPVAGYTIQGILGINHPMPATALALNDINLQKRKREDQPGE